VFDSVYMCVKFQLSSSNSFRDIGGSQIITRGRWSAIQIPYRNDLVQFGCDNEILFTILA